jgi:hypothetical protein
MQSSENLMMNESEKLNSSQTQQQPDPTNGEESIEESAAIRDLVTPQPPSQTTEGDRSPTKTERPVPLEMVMQALKQTGEPDEETPVTRKPLHPEP